MDKDNNSEEMIEVEDTRPEYKKKRVIVPCITAIIFLISGVIYGIPGG